MVPLIRQKLPSLERMATYLRQSEAARQFSNFGPTERLFTERLSVAAGLRCDRRLLLTSSGHTALMTAYAALGVRSLVVPAFTFESTRAAATAQGIDTLLVDVEPSTGCLTPDLLAGLDPSSYDAVAAVCALSTIPDLEALSAFCAAHDKRLIIDGAATWGTPGVAHVGDAYCYSFHATKTLPAGEGGAIVLGAKDFDRAVAFANFGRTLDKRHVGAPGHSINAKMSEFAAAAGLAALDDLEAEVTARLANAARYRSKLGAFIPPTWAPRTVYAFMPTFAPTAAAAERIRAALVGEGVQHLAYYAPLAPLPVSADLFARSVCLPVHSDVDESCIERIANVYQECCP